VAFDVAELTSKELLSRVRDGNSRAAGEIFDRYLRRLIELARQRISPKLARRIDPQDVVQSAYRSFFVHAKNEEYLLASVRPEMLVQPYFPLEWSLNIAKLRRSAAQSEL